MSINAGSVLVRALVSNKIDKCLLLLCMPRAMLVTGITIAATLLIDMLLINSYDK